jgi:hypothetical protein
MMEDYRNKKCPFTRKRCMGEECAIFRKGMRFFDNKAKEPMVFEMCGLNVLIDASENQIMRTIGVQAEMNVLRNNFEKTVSNLIQLGKARQAIEHEVEHRVTQRLLEEGKPKEGVIEIKEADDEDGKTEISNG